MDKFEGKISTTKSLRIKTDNDLFHHPEKRKSSPVLSPSESVMSLTIGLPPPLHIKDCFSSTTNTDGGNFVEESSAMVKLPAPGYKWRLVISYDGTSYAGWQFQTSPPTIQCTVEKALTQVTKLEREDLCLVGAGRTDAGVHAWGQVAHFVTPFSYDKLEHAHVALNGILPADIRVREISPTVPEFHARFSVNSKVYLYKIYNNPIMDPFQRHFAYHSSYRLNATAMRDAALHFIGRHDFSAFANASRNDRIPNPVKNIYRFDVIEQGALLKLEVEGSGFLYRQVRNMVALLLQVGREAVPPSIVPMILETRDRKELAKYALSVPPHGLCLMEVKYKEEHLTHPLDGPSASFGRGHTVRRCKLPLFSSSEEMRATLVE